MCIRDSLNGEIYKGHHLIAGEVSVIYSKDPKQYQSKGLFGAIGSIYNLVDKIAKAKNSETHDGKEVFNWIGAGDKMSQQIFKDYCDEVVLELHNIQCLLDPERICIGGGISENPLFIAGLQREMCIRDRSYASNQKHYWKRKKFACAGDF